MQTEERRKILIVDDDPMALKDPFLFKRQL